MHIMQHPGDLDEFAPEQIEVTRTLDTHGNSRKFGLFMLTRLTMVKMLITSLGGLEQWQRGAYEAHRASKRTGDPADELIANVLWAFVQYLQAEESCAESPGAKEIRKKYSSAGEDGDFDFAEED